MKVAEINGLQKDFKKVQILKNITMDVYSGEILGFIGPNGAGKSTTIRILLGMLRASGGNAKIFGKDSWKESIAIHSKIAYVPGEVNLWPNLTGGEVIDLFMNLQGINTESSRKKRLIEKFQFDPSKKIRNYSKGNRQKIALIVALSSDADFFIFDEPTSGLDPLMEVIFQEEVKEFKSKGKSILLSSHILSEVEHLCDRVAIIRQGEVIETGTLEELRHLTRYEYIVTTQRKAEILENISGVYDLSFRRNQAIFQVGQEDVQSVLEALLPYNVVNLESNPPTLEELFLRHYQEKV
ncbi:MAG: ABC transporter ATP-binding protein [Lactobacillales bacterium]|nr:ABC transporter ATP-binding protein [Lactobacillales bacterium]